MCCSKKCCFQYAKLTRKQTCIEKYGVEYSSQSEQIKIKYKKTCKEKYGVENLYQSKKTNKSRKIII